MAKAGRNNKLLVLLFIGIAIFFLYNNSNILSNFSTGIAAFSRSWENLPILGQFALNHVFIAVSLIFIVYKSVYSEKRFLS